MATRINPDLTPSTGMVGGPYGRSTIVTNPGSATGTKIPPTRLPVERNVPPKGSVPPSMKPPSFAITDPVRPMPKTGPWTRPSGSSTVQEHRRSKTLEGLARGQHTAIRDIKPRRRRGDQMPERGKETI